MAKKISKKFSYIGENIKKIRQAKGISQAEFAAIFNLGRPAVGAYEEGRSEPKIDTIIQIAKHFSITIDALLTKQLSVAEIYSFDRLNKKLDLVHSKKDIKSNHDGIPIVRTNQFLDYVIQHKDSEFIKSLETINSPVPLKNARIFEMKGNDMENQGQGLNPGDLLFCSKADLKKLKLLKTEVVVTITEDEVFCKRLESVDKDELDFSSDAKTVSNIRKPLKDISEIWVVKGHYSVQIQPPSKLEDRMSQLEEMVKKLGG